MKNYILIFFLALYFLFKNIKNILPCTFIDQPGNFLLLTAHPDDESMFFAPTILNLKGDLTIICFSTGNYLQETESEMNMTKKEISEDKNNYFANNFMKIEKRNYEVKRNKIRLKELKNVCKFLNRNNKFIQNKEIINRNYLNTKCIILNLQDNSDWDTNEIVSIIRFYNLIYNFNCIFTFDRNGVSNHKNHISLFFATRKFRQEIPVKCYYLNSKNIWYKYFIDFSLNKNSFCSGIIKYFTSIRMMLFHKSQILWFRILYIFFSNFMIYNDYTDLDNI
ncbi:putative GlcNAc-PI de-N-acetylase [Hamiltosporidium tvaerminnensis]|uniref:N-acetylglucosaminylphosphatidylinositol deacetylase n=1 Tax=Hamiltosporidium tvaerminnensis TaxID=1176355 RepID=A0A4Q9L093_9MICR|nr:putative GlcNAc-PI de-N-acetylase [Hamiltosporidium tvaerminnensis]